VSQWRNRLREMEGLAAGCFLNKKKSKHSERKWLLELWLSNHVTPTFDAGPLPSEVRVPWGPPTIKYDSHNFLLA
jgi:hypothetical protein